MLFRSRTLLGYPQVSASIYRNPTDVYHANQPQLKLVEYSFKKIIEELQPTEVVKSFKRVQVIGISHTDYSVAQSVKGCLWNAITKKLSNRFLKVNVIGNEEYFYVGAFFVYTVLNINTSAAETRCCIFGRWLQKIGMCRTLKSLKLRWEKNRFQRAPSYLLPGQPHWDIISIDSVLGPAMIVPVLVGNADFCHDVHSIGREFILAHWGSAIGTT